jgi:hypothetical protein
VLPAESKQLGREHGRASRRVSDFGNVIRDGALHPQLVEKKIAVAENGREEIIEVVRDATGKLSKRFHFLRADELVLELFARCHVHEGADELDRLAIAIANNMRAFEQVEIRAVHVTEAIFSSPMIGFACQCVTNAGGRARAILRMNLLLPETDVARFDGTAVAEQGFESLRPGESAAGYRPNPNSIIRSLGSERKMFRDFIRALR